MDRNSIVGILLIFAILVVFSLINQPSQEEIEAARKRQDSIALVKEQRALQFEQERQKLEAEQPEETVLPDSVINNQLLKEKIDQYGVFGNAAIGNEEFYTLENNLMKITFTNKGGRIYSVELKNYQTHDSLPLILFEGDETLFGLNFFAQNRIINTDQLFFTPTFTGQSVVVNGPEVRRGSEGRINFNEENPGESSSVAFRLEVAPGRFMEYIYSLDYNSYMVDFDVNMQEMNQYIASNQNYLTFTWGFDVPRQERPSKFGEDRYTNINFKFYQDDVDNLSKSKSDEENLTTRVKWIAYKQLFFSSTLIADEAFPNALVRSERYEDDPEFLANFYSEISLPYEGTASERVGLEFYFGPNHYQTLRQYDLDLERQIDLGYAVVRPVNKYLIIPTFNFLRRFIDNFGIIILLLTIFIKTILFPFTYKSYVSQAKMRR